MNVLQDIWHGHGRYLEEAFKDLKDLRGGLQLKGFKMKQTGRLGRLLAVAILAYLVLILAGMVGEQRGWHRRLQVNTAAKRCLAIWRVGYLLLEEGAITVRDALVLIDILATTLVD